MNYGFNLASAGVLTAMYRQDVAANNLANIETIGFKVDQTSTVARSAAREEDGLWDLPSNRLLERLGAGVLLGPNQTSHAQGPLQTTANPLDVAIRGDGFFMVATGQGGANPHRLTRDGRLTLDKGGRLVTAAGGKAVLDTTGSEITLNPKARITVHTNGAIEQNGGEVARLAVVDVADKSMLSKEGEGLFRAPASVISQRRPASGDVIQQSIERSNADPIRAMMQVTDATSAASGATRILTIHDELMSRAINTLGRVS